MALSCTSNWILVVVGTLLESQLHAGRRITSLIVQRAVVGTLLESLSLAQTVSDPGMRLRGDLPKWRASSLDWCANPSSSRDRGANPGFGTLLES